MTFLSGAGRYFRSARMIPAAAILLLGLWHAADVHAVDASLPNDHLSTQRLLVKKILLTGNTALPAEEVTRLTSGYENREVTFDELDNLRQQLTLLYIAGGYVNSGVLIPDQRVFDGTVYLRAVEGVVGEVRIEGNRRFAADYFLRRLERVTGPPANVHAIAERLRLFQIDLPLRRIDAEFAPGDVPGEGKLRVNVEEENPWTATIAFANNQSPAVGPYRGELSLAHRNLFGRGHILAGTFGISEGSHDVAAGYTLPLTADDLLLNLFYTLTEGTVTEEDFRELDIESDTESYGLTVTFPIIKELRREFSLTLTGERRRDTTFLLGVPFSFGDTANNVSRATVIRFGQEWINRNPAGAVALRSVFSLGIDALGATIAGSGADGRFFSWRGQAALSGREERTGIEGVFRADLQLAKDPLLPMERFSLGGMTSVRGYRENRLVRDNGAVISLEARLPLAGRSDGEPALQLAPFADFGWSWNTGRSTTAPTFIAGIGAGLRWMPLRSVFCAVYAGYPVKRVEGGNDDLQDIGVHFQFQWQVF